MLARYARVSILDQIPSLRFDALHVEGCGGKFAKMATASPVMLASAQTRLMSRHLVKMSLAITPIVRLTHQFL